MNERQEKTADVLGKLTVLGTIVLPMNIICGMWGMNVKVPGQEIDNLNWFFCSTFSLFPRLQSNADSILENKQDVNSVTVSSRRWPGCVRLCLISHRQTRLQNRLNRLDGFRFDGPPVVRAILCFFFSFAGWLEQQYDWCWWDLLFLKHIFLPVLDVMFWTIYGSYIFFFRGFPASGYSSLFMLWVFLDVHICRFISLV